MEMNLFTMAQPKQTVTRV